MFSGVFRTCLPIRWGSLMVTARSSRYDLDFDRRLRLEFHGAKLTSDAGLLAYRELDDALDLTASAAAELRDTRVGWNSRHGLTALPSVDLQPIGRLRGPQRRRAAPLRPRHEDRRGRPGRRRYGGLHQRVARCETEALTTRENLNRLMDLSGRWIDRAHRHRKLTKVVLDMDSWVS